MIDLTGIISDPSVGLAVVIGGLTMGLVAGAVAVAFSLLLGR